VLQTSFFAPWQFAPGVSFVRLSGIRFTLFGSTIVQLIENIGVHHVQIDNCGFSWNQYRSIDLAETGEQGALYLRIFNCRFHHMNQEAIQSAANYCHYRGNEFYHSMDPRWRVRRDSGIAVRVIGNSTVVEYNYIHDYFPINGVAISAIDLEAGNPLPTNPSHTIVRYNVIENSRSDEQDVRAITLNIPKDSIRNRIHHNLVLNPGTGLRMVAPKTENYITHNSFLNAKREGIFFYGMDDPLGEYLDFEVFNSARSPARNVIQNNVIFQNNGQDFTHLFKLTKGYQRRSELGDNTFLANHWSDEDHSFGRETSYGNPRLTNGYEPAADSPLVDSGAPLTQTVSAGRGTGVPVEDSRFFTDGHGIAEGDSVRVGDNQPQRIVRVDPATHMLRFAGPLRWEKGDPVSFPWTDRAPDRGALERGLPWPHLDWLPENCPLHRKQETP